MGECWVSVLGYSSADLASDVLRPILYLEKDQWRRGSWMWVEEGTGWRTNQWTAPQWHKRPRDDSGQWWGTPAVAAPGDWYAGGAASSTGTWAGKGAGQAAELSAALVAFIEMSFCMDPNTRLVMYGFLLGYAFCGIVGCLWSSRLWMFENIWKPGIPKLCSWQSFRIYKILKHFLRKVERVTNPTTWQGKKLGSQDPITFVWIRLARKHRS